jgi:hypothetical protein
MDWTAIIGYVLTLIGVWIINNKQLAVIEEKLSQTKAEIAQLKEEQRKHNAVIERTYKLEEQSALQDAELHRHNERLRILEEQK